MEKRVIEGRLCPLKEKFFYLPRFETGSGESPTYCTMQFLRTWIRRKTNPSLSLLEEIMRGCDS